MLILTKEEEALILARRQEALKAKTRILCPRCNGTGEVFSGLYGHPETDGHSGKIMYKCFKCSGFGDLPA